MLDVIKSFKNPQFTSDAEQSVLRLIREGELSIKKPKSIIKAFEDKLTQIFGNYCLALNNGTAALFCAFQALELTAEDEVIVPSFVWHASVSPLNYTKAKVVICDVDPNSYVLDLNMLESLITSRTKAVLALHLFGTSIDMSKLMTLCTPKNIKVIEDCSHAIGVKQNGKLLGTFGDFGCFSLQQGKLITGGEVGFIRVKNPEAVKKVIAIGLPARPFEGELQFAGASMGLKFRPHPLAVSLANSQLNQLEEISKKQINTYNFAKEQLQKTQIPMTFQEKNDEDGHFHLRILLAIEAEKKEKIIENLQTKTNAFQKEDYFLTSKLTFLNFSEINEANAKSLTEGLIYLHLPKVLNEKNKDLLEKSIQELTTSYQEVCHK